MGNNDKHVAHLYLSYFRIQINNYLTMFIVTTAEFVPETNLHI